MPRIDKELEALEREAHAQIARLRDLYAAAVKRIPALQERGRALPAGELVAMDLLREWSGTALTLAYVIGELLGENPPDAEPPPQPIPEQEKPAAAPVNASLSVDGITMNGARFVRLVIPQGAEAVAVALPPEVAEQLARSLAAVARNVRSPSGLILPG